MRFAAIIFVALLATASLGFAVSVDSKVREKLETEDKVQVIIKLKNPAIDQAKSRSARSVNAYETENINRKHVTPTLMSGEVTQEILEKLQDDPNIESIRIDRTFTALLSQSAPLINATNVWPIRINGQNLTGRGETVCVIDTGVNYSHPALGGCFGLGCRVIAGYDFVNDDSDPMDDNSHGTHVAGIVASNDSTYRGIAPEAKIVAIKVLNSAGNGFESDVIAGIKWCTANATQYNISVISMSLGGSNYASYCDNVAQETEFRDAINNATRYNISVVAATGNDASTSTISSPACIQNATAVGATYDANVGGIGYSSCTDGSSFADKIACFTNRNSLLDLLAPGTITTSADLTAGAFANKAGTSMATPMVSGAFAILHQYKMLSSGTNATGPQIENAFKSSGVNISDSSTGLTFRRINILAALKASDITKPVLVVSSPVNITYNASNISISYVASDDISLDQCWFTDTDGTIVSLSSSAGACRNATFLLTRTHGNITVYANDTQGNQNSSTIFFTLNMPIITIQLPANGAVLNFNSSIPLNFTIQNLTAIDDIWYSIDGGSSVTILGNATFNASEGNHVVTLFANNTFGITGNATANFTIDSTRPSIILSGPINQTLDTTNDFVINITLNENGSALIEWNGTNLSASGNGTSFNRSFLDIADGNYTFKIYANDTAGNMNVSSVSWIYVNATRNFTSYFNSVNSSISQNNATLRLLNSTGASNFSSIFLDTNYTLQMSIENIVASIANFSWLTANTSNVVNITRNVTLENISAVFNSSGGVLDNYVWVDVNNFTASYTPVVSFPGRFHLVFYINGTRDAPELTRINSTCNANITNTPCYLPDANTTVYLSSFSGAAAGNDTQAPSISVTSPSGTYSSSNVTVSCSASDNAGVDSYWYSLNEGSNTSFSSCSTTLIAASGSNSLIVYANDTSGNTNSTSVTFTFTAPAAQSSGSGGGGGGGGIAAPSAPTQKIQSWDSITGSAVINVGVPSISAKTITVNVDGTIFGVSAKVLAERNAPFLNGTYQYFSINFTNLPDSRIVSAEIIFVVNRSFADARGKSNIYLFRNSGGWNRLPTALISENATHYTYASTTPGFSYFAVAAQEPLPAAVPAGNTTNATAPKPICIQVITPATNNGRCVLYPTPCDVPAGWTVVNECPTVRYSPLNDDKINGILIFVFFMAGLAIIYRMLYHKKKQRNIEHKIRHHKRAEWKDDKKIYSEYQKKREKIDKKHTFDEFRREIHDDARKKRAK